MAIGIGSNIDPEENLKRAAEALRKQWPETRFSNVYKTAPRDVEDQPDFLNAVAVIDSELSPDEIHATLKGIENELEKKPPYLYGPRTIDLDFLIFGTDIVDTDDLSVPHQRMNERRFVLEPLCDVIDSEESHPIFGESWKELLEKTLDQECVRTDTTL